MFRVSTQAGEAHLGVHTFRCSPRAFDLAPRLHRQRRWVAARRGSGGETTVRAIERGAWFEQTVDHGLCGLRCLVREAMMSPVKVPKPYQSKEEAKREQEQEGRKSHTGPRCLKLEEWDTYLEE